MTGVAEMKKACAQCPFVPETRRPGDTDEDIARALARIKGGERWICHMTCGPVGSEWAFPDRKFCAGAPLPPETANG